MSFKEYVVCLQEELLICGICNNLWIGRDPRILNCSHIFCFECLVNSINNEITDENNLVCYHCGKIINIPVYHLQDLKSFTLIKSLELQENISPYSNNDIGSDELRLAVENEMRLMNNLLDRNIKEEENRVRELMNHVRGVEKMFENQVKNLKFEIKFQYERHRRLIRYYIKTYNWFSNSPDKILRNNATIINRIKELRKNAITTKIDLRLNENYLESIGRVEVINNGSFTNFLIKKRQRVIGAPDEIIDIAIGMNNVYLLSLFKNTNKDIWKIFCYDLHGNYINSDIDINEFESTYDRNFRRKLIISKCKLIISYDYSLLYLSSFYENEINKIQLFGQKKSIKRFCKIDAKFLCSIVQGILIVDFSLNILLFNEKGEKFYKFHNQYDIISICNLRLPNLICFINKSNELFIMNINNVKKITKVHCTCKLSGNMQIRSLSSSIAVMNQDEKSIIELYYNGTAFRDIIAFQDTPICMTTYFKENKDFLYVITKDNSGFFCLNIYKSVSKF